ncbi:hypothetical protein C8R43DRAFT_1062958 [Mycena crocata]|nr:hypothetical protein C8R43DRAFT_1062958 [Mycena crocata]
MHRAFSILEVIEAVFCELYVPKELAALAVTCKSFQDPALDVLWRTQDSIIPLLACMPDDLFNMRPNLSSSRGLHLVRPITPTDWERSRKYAVRVKHFEFQWVPRISEIFPALDLALPCGCLFPKLQSLSWSSHSEAGFRFLRMFLTPTLSTLGLAYQPSILKCSFLSTLGSFCPKLKDVSVNIHRDVTVDEDHCIAATSQLVCSLGEVQCLTIDEPDLVALQHIERLPHLTRLNLRYLPNGPYQAPNPQSIFPKLRSLTIHAGELEAYAEYLQMCSQLTLNSIELSFDNFSPAASTRGLYTAMAACCSHACLTRISLVLWGGSLAEISGDRAIDFAVNDALFRILFCFPNIEFLLIESPVDFDVCDTTLAEAARTWTRLKQLQLNVLIRSPSWPFRATINALSSFAEHCPHLHSLHLTLDATVLPAEPTSIPFVPQTQLTELCIAQSPIANPGAVASFISDLFPNLRTIGTPPCCRVPADFVERWQQVELCCPCS